MRPRRTVVPHEPNPIGVEIRVALNAVHDPFSVRRVARPVCIRVGWSSGGGHFLAIYGWLIAGRGTKYYVVADLIYGTSQVAQMALLSSYQGDGSSSHSYHVAQPSAAGAGVSVMASRAIDPTSIGG